MDHRIKDVLIVGGGTAGWMTAAYLGKALEGSARITVLEAPTIPKIGVGEATVPNLQRVFFDFLGLKEEDWMRECNAAFKTAVRFVNWRTPGEASPTPRAVGGQPDRFYHPFGLLPARDRIPLSHYWFFKQRCGATDEPFDHACFKEVPLMDARLAPRTLDGRPATHYAWHFDAHLVADFLRRFATERLGVVHIQDELDGVTFGPDGAIASVHTRGGRTIAAALFVDCSGFRGLLINKALREPFLDMSDHLLCDSAVAASVPDDARDGIDPFTSAIAMPAGWTWKIPMLGRFGTGYVYASAFAREDEAVRDFCRLWRLDEATAQLNKLRFRVGRNRRAWVKNCVSIGLSSCFLEPLESTGIYFITAAIYQLVKHFPDDRFDPILSASFNREIEAMFDDTRDFIQAHFRYGPRTDTAFWRANKELALSDAIVDKVAMYRAGLAINPPSSDAAAYYEDFDLEFRNFWTNGSYYAIFAGLGFLPDHPLPLLAHRADAARRADPLFAAVKQQQRELVATLPTNHDYLVRLHAR